MPFHLPAGFGSVRTHDRRSDDPMVGRYPFTRRGHICHTAPNLEHDIADRLQDDPVQLVVREVGDGQVECTICACIVLARDGRVDVVQRAAEALAIQVSGPTGRQFRNPHLERLANFVDLLVVDLAGTEHQQAERLGRRGCLSLAMNTPGSGRGR